MRPLFSGCGLPRSGLVTRTVTTPGIYKTGTAALQSNRAALLFGNVSLALGALSLAFLVWLVVGIWKRSRLLIWLGGIPLAGGLCLIAFLVCFFLYSVFHTTSDTTSGATIRSSFVDNFGSQPGPDFVPIHQRIFSIADCGGLYLEFKAAPSTFKKIRSMKFEPSAQWEFFERTAGPYAPTWWVRTNQITGDCYRNSNWKGPFYGNRAYLYYETNSCTLYFLTEGSD